MNGLQKSLLIVCIITIFSSNTLIVGMKKSMDERMLQLIDPWVGKQKYVEECINLAATMEENLIVHFLPRPSKMLCENSTARMNAMSLTMQARFCGILETVTIFSPEGYSVHFNYDEFKNRIALIQESNPELQERKKTKNCFARCIDFCLNKK